MIDPLRKRTRDGKLYTRPPVIEAKIIELALLSHDELITRCAIRPEDDLAYVPSECLLYFIRASRTNRADTYFEKLYKLLLERVLSRLSKKVESPDSKKTLLTSSIIRDEVIGRFAELLAIDRIGYSEKLDFFEVRFNRALKSICSDVQEQAWRDKNRSIAFDDDETGEPTVEVERAAGSFDPFNTSEFSGDGYRFALNEAIDTLPPLERRIIEMLKQDFPIDSQDPDAITIARALGKSEKTIRTYRDKAFVTLRTALSGGDQS